MCSLSEMLNRVNLVKENIISFTSEIIQESDVEFEIIQLNKNQLYDFGMDSQNNKLSPYRSRIYAEMKFDIRGQELTDLFLSGNFQREFYLEVEGVQYLINSSDEKTSSLVLKYGEQIFGLNQENKEKAFFIIKPRLLEKCNDILQCELI